jgi:hypothetical protein
MSRTVVRRRWIMSTLFVLVTTSAFSQMTSSQANATGNAEQRIKAAQQQLLNGGSS